MSGTVHIQELFDGGFKDYSTYNTYRSIPSIVDGLKNGQRKCIYGASKIIKGDKTVKVASLAGTIGSMTEYHHGEASLADTIVKLAQSFPGSNNINLMYPDGQFGSILNPGASAAHRYIFSKPSDSYPFIFREEDECILEYQEEEGKKIEPKNYFPIIPMSLVNGARGIGTGYATNVANYNPIEIIDELIKVLSGKKKTFKSEWIPSYTGYEGTVTRDSESDSIVFTGKYNLVNTTTLEITALPLGITQEKYKEHLNKLEDAGIVKSYSDFSTEDGFKFKLSIPRTTSKLSKAALIKTFKLTSKDSENLNLWHGDTLVHYSSIKHIMTDFHDLRLPKYQTRKTIQLDLIKAKIRKSTEKLNFIKWYLKNTLQFTKFKKADLMSELESQGFKDIETLIRIPLFNLTREEIAKLAQKVKDLKAAHAELKATSPEDIWIKELKDLKQYLNTTFTKES